jgi:pimeloyl-ACP methyl ester carboxylesterase
MKSNTPTLRFLILFLAAILSLVCFAQATKIKKGKSMQSGKSEFVTSKDGTKIAYDKAGEGAALIIVGGALSDRKGAAAFAGPLSKRFTVYSYDRRGRGESGDVKPYAVAREVEDLEALIDAAGGKAYVYGKSSGAALALQAAAALGNKIQKLALYEAPYSDAEGAAREWKAFRAKLDGLLAADRRSEAVSEFLEFVGAPKEAIAGMKASPAWAGMVAMAPTLAYDNSLLGDDRSVPVQVAAKVKAQTLVMDGEASLKTMPFMRPTADKIAGAIPRAERRTLEGQGHDVDPKVLAAALVKFFLN